ncbi:MAG: hypothetical protein EOO77_03935 [Oxalobacteraceae bacterium]|nr:MAG: hypothetical protein EOO77_03935 [Oxalobacteraceae bacterium]
MVRSFGGTSNRRPERNRSAEQRLSVRQGATSDDTGLALASIVTSQRLRDTEGLEYEWSGFAALHLAFDGLPHEVSAIFARLQ